MPPLEFGKSTQTAGAPTLRFHADPYARRPLTRGARGVARALWVGACLALSLAAAPGAAQEEGEAATNRRMAFDIASQPLAPALAAFSASTGVEVLVDARNAQGRRSSGVTGVMTAREALRILLADARLVPDEFAPGTVLLMRFSGASGASPPSPEPPYFATVQRAVSRTLCAIDADFPGSYRLALRLRIAASGAVTQAKRLDTTGRPERDLALDAALFGLDVGEPPPPDLPQPIAVVVARSGARGSPRDCPVVADKGRRTPGPERADR